MAGAGEAMIVDVVATTTMTLGFLYLPSIVIVDILLLTDCSRALFIKAHCCGRCL